MAVTRAAVEIARPGVSVEAEIGSVGYSDNADAKRRFTDPGRRSAARADRGGRPGGGGGNGAPHGDPGGGLAVRPAAPHPPGGEDSSCDPRLHGCGRPDLRRLIECGAVKINMGTTLRMVFGQALREQIEENPKLFDQ